MSTLCVKVSFGSHLVRRVTFNQPPHSVSIDLFREKIANTFSLSLDYNAFRIAYRDDDGDETEILSSLDLTEAIHYFADDVDDSAPSGSSSNGSGGSTSKQRITIKVNLFVDYEGPSLSDRGSVVGTSENGSAWGDGRNRSEWSASRDGDGRDWQGSADGSQWDDEGRSSVGGYDDGRRGPSGSYHYSSSSYSHQPPPPLPPLPPRPPTSYDPRFHHPSSSSSSSPWPPYQSSYSQPPYPSSSSSSSAYSYNTPSAPPLPTLTRLNSNSGRRRDSDESTHRGGSSSTSTSTSNSSGSGSGSSSGRTDLLLFDLGRADPSSSRQPPLPPTYASNSGSGSGSGSSNDARESGNGNGNGRDGEQRRWLKSQEERLSHFAAVKAARREGEGEGEEGGGGGGEQDGEYEGSEAGGGGDQRLLRPPPPPLPNSQTPTPPLDLPTYLAHLSLSRRSPSPSPSHSRMPTPSILSSVPDSLLRCCGSGCGKELTAFRYVCALCGPILPTSEEEEEEEVRGRGDGDSESEGGVSDDGTQLGGVSRREEGGEGGGEERPLLAGEEGGEAMMDDPLGVNLARETRLPLSPISSPTVLLPPSSFQPPANLILTNEGVYLSTSPSAAPTPASPAAEEQEQEQEQEEPNGFELCSDCIETEGVKHANAMAALARSRGGGAGAGGVQELKHSFCEVMKMGRGSMWQGWREVDYDDDVTCSTCGSGPVQTNRFKCISCPKMELCLACYRSVEEIHPIHSFLAIPDRPARPRSSPSFPSSSSGSSSAGGSDPSSSSSSSFSGHATAEEMRLAILRARGVGGGAVVQRGEPPRLPPKPLKHEGVLCFGCLSDIVGARYSCSQCPSFDLCSKCESLEPPITSPDGYHTSAHILLKINIPVAEELILDATDRARAMTREGGSAIHHHHDQRRRRASSPRGRYRDHDRHARPPIEYERWYAARQQQDPYHHANGGAPPLPPHFFGPPPPHYFTPSGAPWAAPPPPPPPPNYHPSASPLPPIMRAHPRAAEQQSLVVHNVRCRACRKGIKGIRWTCANCGTTPTFDLCSSCERSSHTLHNPLHCFLRLTQPLSKPLPPLSQFLPVLYDPSTPPTHYETANGTGGSSNGSSDGLGEAIVLHPQVICDCCGEAILGPWNRCCHCPNSFDVCTPCLHQIHHDPSHVFLKFTRKVDLALFRELTQLSTANPQPLLTYGVYS